MVKCLRCSYEILRHTFQNVLTQLNPHLAVIPKEDIVRPDGDVELRLLEIIRLKKLTPTMYSTQYWFVRNFGQLKKKGVGIGFFFENLRKEYANLHYLVEISHRFL